MVKGLSHVTFVVTDLDKMTRFLESIFDAKEIYRSGDQTFSISRERFFLIGGVWVAIMEGPSLSERTYNHIAFEIDESEFAEYAGRLSSLDVEVREGRSRVTGEGRSLYFYDDDNHLFELHTGTLEERLQRYEGLAVTLREGRGSEAAVLSRLAMHSKAYWGYSDDFLAACCEELKVDPARFGTAGFHCVVADKDSQPIGFYVLARKLHHLAKRGHVGG